MDNQQERYQIIQSFKWKIRNFSKLDTTELYSEKFLLCGQPWRIIFFPKWDDVESLVIFFFAGDHTIGWNRFTIFKLFVFNQYNENKTIREETRLQFQFNRGSWADISLLHFLPIHEICNSSSGFIVNDTCIFGAEISVISEDRVFDILPGSFGELTDFRGLVEVEKDYIPLLEEVCTWYPSLIEWQQDRSRVYTHMAFTALGRLLHFLKTRKLKDMNDHACDYLQELWIEVETFSFDVSWLRHHVRFALDMNSYVKKAAQVKWMKEKVAALDMQVKRLKEKLAAAEEDLDIAIEELMRAQEGFQELDLDAELGYRVECSDSCS